MIKGISFVKSSVYGCIWVENERKKKTQKNGFSPVLPSEFGKRTEYELCVMEC